MRIVKKYLNLDAKPAGGSNLEAWPDKIEDFENLEKPKDDDEKKPEDFENPDELNDKNPTNLDIDEKEKEKPDPKEIKKPDDKDNLEDDDFLSDENPEFETEEITWGDLAKELDLGEDVENDLDKFKEGFKKRIERAKTEGFEEAQAKQKAVSIEEELSKLPVEAQAQFKILATGDTFKDEKTQINNLKGWIEVEDEALLRAVYKEKKWDDERIERKIAILAQSDSLKDEADDVRIELREQIDQKEKQIQVKTDENWKTLIATLKNKENEFSTEVKNHIGKLTKIFDVPLKEKNIQRLNEGLESFRKRITTDPDFVAKVYANHVYGEQAVKVMSSEKFKEGRKESIAQFRNSRTPADNKGAGRSRAAAKSQQSNSGTADGSHFADWDDLIGQ